jgi:hypothetical protein
VYVLDPGFSRQRVFAFGLMMMLLMMMNHYSISILIELRPMCPLIGRRPLGIARGEPRPCW